MRDLKETLIQVTDSLEHFVPEIVLGVLILLVVLLDLFFMEKRVVIGATAVGFLLALGFVILQWDSSATGNSRELFAGMARLDHMAIFLKAMFLVASLITLSMSYREVRQRKKVEYAVFFGSLVAALLGAFLLLMATNLLMIYLAIELISISSYILTTLGLKKSNAEAGLKYLLTGALASGILLYGLSWIYGFTGTLDITAGEFAQRLTEVPVFPMAVSVVLVIVGITFKLSAFPLHIWAPDVYQVAPTSIVAFFSVVPKLAGMVVLFKFIMAIHAFGMGTVNWQLILSIIALFTLTIGNFSALWQHNVKRMMAYSSIAHSGFLLVGIVAFSPLGMKSFLFYSTVYLFMNYGVFMLIHQMELKHNSVALEIFKGLGKSLPFYGVAMVIMMIALTGLPPTSGFTAKLLVFSSLWETYNTTGASHLLLLLVFGLLNAVVSLFYYLKIPYQMFFKTGENMEFERFSWYENFLTGFLVLAVLILFVKPGWLLEIINNINFAL